MNDDVRAQLIKQQRREILRILREASPAPFTFEAICHVLVPLGAEVDLIWRDLNYLIDKGYARRHDQGDFVSRTRRLFVITAKGDEVANRIEHDRALDL